MVNHLAQEKSPYLLQHAHNPVDWYPWGEATFEKAKRESKPVFLSIGYATCHWCHVMAHESFEDEEVAAFLNDHFVSIKVDREERPDLDALYMTACQALTGRGGWPLSVFLTPDGKPFYAGTYFPRNSRFGMPGFLDILRRIAMLWENQPQKVHEAGDQITAFLEKTGESDTGAAALSFQTFENAVVRLRRVYDQQWGGFGNAPKFPTPDRLTFLLRWHHQTGNASALEMVETTLRAMRRGGIFDQVGLGFHRYSVDVRWHVPHFEKMLYDQALLMHAYGEAFQVTRNPLYASTVMEIFDYLQREMRHGDGGYFSAEDADSEGEEGSFYLWTPREVKQILGEEKGGMICRFFGITEEGNFERGKSIPFMPGTHEAFAEKEGMPLNEWLKSFETARLALFKERERRVHPMKDDKVLTSWNGLMIAALASAGRGLNEASLLDAAKEAEAFVWNHLFLEGILYHRFRQGHVGIEGFLEDYAFLTWGELELYEATFVPEYLEKALQLQEMTRRIFWDDSLGGFYFSKPDGLSPLPRRMDLYDGATPSGNSVALSNLARLGAITGETQFLTMAEKMIRAFASRVAASPEEYGHFLKGALFALGPSKEVVITGENGDKTLQQAVYEIQKAYLPDAVLVYYDPEDSRMARLCPYLRSFPEPEGRFSVFVCENRSCREPITDLERLRKYLGTS